MAEVVKRLRPRIVVPICVGSNPIFRPIFKVSTFGCFFIRNDRGFQGSDIIGGSQQIYQMLHANKSYCFCKVLMVEKLFNIVYNKNIRELAKLHLSLTNLSFPYTKSKIILRAIITAMIIALIIFRFIFSPPFTLKLVLFVMVLGRYWNYPYILFSTCYGIILP